MNKKDNLKKDSHINDSNTQEDSKKKESEDSSKELWDKYLRLQAEFDNYKKRTFKERQDFIKFANEGLILELLSILDNFERGIKSAEQKKDYELLHQGVDMISKQLHGLLETKGLNRIQSIGQPFDPHKHEAIEVVAGDDKEADIIVEELQPGYALNGRIIRPAKVKVLKSKEEEEKKESEIVKEDGVDNLEKEEKGKISDQESKEEKI